MFEEEIKNHEILFDGSSTEIGKINFYIQKSSSNIHTKTWIKKTGLLDGKKLDVDTDELTEFGAEVKFNEIHWWIFKKETNIKELLKRTYETLDFVLKLKRESDSLKKTFMNSYPDVIQTIKKFTEDHKEEIRTLYEYVIWLNEKDILAPSILFTRKIWKSTRLKYEIAQINLDTEENQEIIKRCTEVALGLRHETFGYILNEEYMEISYQIYDSDPENYGSIPVPFEQLYIQTASQIFDRLATFFQLIRNSLDEIVDEIENYEELNKLLCSPVDQRSNLGKSLAFISHDSRDKQKIASHIAVGLTDMRCPVWYDEYSLKIGDSLRESIERGLKECEKCIILLSPNFLSNKGWTKREFETIYTRELIENKNIFLPVWIGVNKKEIYEYCPILVDRVAADWSLGKDIVIKKLYQAIFSVDKR